MQILSSRLLPQHIRYSTGTIGIINALKTYESRNQIRLFVYVGVKINNMAVDEISLLVDVI